MSIQRRTKNPCDECKEIGAKKPKYIVHGGDIMVQFKPVMHSPNAKKELTEREKAIIEQISANPAISILEIASNLGLTERQVRYVVDSLRKHGILIRDGSNKTGNWKLLR